MELRMEVQGWTPLGWAVVELTDQALALGASPGALGLPGQGTPSPQAGPSRCCVAGRQAPGESPCDALGCLITSCAFHRAGEAERQ